MASPNYSIKKLEHLGNPIAVSRQLGGLRTGPLQGAPEPPGAGDAAERLLTSKAECRPGEPVRVFHVCESMAPYPPPEAESPLAPAPYDGRVHDGPGIDANYEVTEYRFEVPEVHTIEWRLGSHVSDLVRIEVSSERAG